MSSRVSFQQLRQIVRHPIQKPHSGMSQNEVLAHHAFFVASRTLMEFFGKQWVSKHSMFGASNKFLHTNPYDQTSLGTHVIRVVELAELLFNSQTRKGFEGVVEKFEGGQIESAFAELEIGKLLRRYQIPFSFIKEIGVRGSDYDIQFTHPNGLVCCGEVKSKVENSTPLTEQTIVDSLQTARKQLDPAKPSVIFLKVPQNWFRDEGFDVTFSNAVTRFHTSRVVSVIGYASVLEHTLVRTDVWRWTTERLLSGHRYAQDVDWRLVSGRPVPDHDPAGWLRLQAMCLRYGTRIAR